MSPAEDTNTEIFRGTAVRFSHIANHLKFAVIPKAAEITIEYSLH